MCETYLCDWEFVHFWEKKLGFCPLALGLSVLSPIFIEHESLQRYYKRAIIEPECARSFIQVPLQYTCKRGVP